MKAKKSKQANLERLRVPFILMGLACSAALVLTAFEWRTFEHEELTIEDGLVITPPLEDETIFTAEVMKPPTKPKPRVVRAVVDDYVAVDDDQRIDIPLDLPLFDDEDEPVIDDIGDLIEDPIIEDFILIAPVMPEFPGGQIAMLEYLGNSIKYPPMDKDAGIQGKVFVSFIVDKSGYVRDVEIVRGVSEGLDQETIRVIEQMPKWSPGVQRGRPVSVKLNIPVNYIIN